MTTKDKVAEATKRLRDAARLQDPMARLTVDLVGLLVEEAKERLVSADGVDIPRIQGAAREFRALHRNLTNQPPAIKQEKI